jgi:hypothetical protein
MCSIFQVKEKSGPFIGQRELRSIHGIYDSVGGKRKYTLGKAFQNVLGSL